MANPKTKALGLATPSAVGAPPGKGPSTKASTPYSTADGRPKVTDAQDAGGADFVANPRGSPQPGGERDVVRESRPQRLTGGQPSAAADVAAHSRPQTPTTAAQRLGGAQNLPVDGSRPHVVPTRTPAWRMGAGSVDDAGRPVGGRPFKNLKG